MIQLKDNSVNLKDLSPQIVFAIFVVERIFEDIFKNTVMVITSANDGKHKVDSRHYKGLAVDIRCKFLDPAKVLLFVNRCREFLGVHFDVLHEYIGTDNEHIHLQYKPKF